MRIGVLGLQGAVAEHVKMIEKLGSEAIVVKKAGQIANLDGIIIPGGESTTIGKLIKQYGIDKELKIFNDLKKPIYGTCAGLIIIAKEINGQEDNHVGLLDINVERNGFGRQKESFEVDLKIKDIADDFPAVFIRAPYIKEIGSNVEVLSEYDGKMVAVRQDNLLGTSFHPELTDDLRIHKYFVDMVEKYKNN